jgi:HNH endonuclease
MARRILPDLAFLNECLLYEPCTGTLMWKVRPREHFRTKRGWNTFNARYAGRSATTLNRTGYYRVRFYGQGYFAQHIVWKMHTGNDCTAWLELDHINRKRTDNRIENLREVTGSQNCANSARRVGKSGIMGVHIKSGARGDRYRAAINVNGCKTFLGTFATLEEASDAYQAAKKVAHGEFWPPTRV